MEGDLTEGFLNYEFGGLSGGACTWRGLFSEFYGIERGPSKTMSRGAWLPEDRSGHYGEDVVYFRC